MPTKNEKIANAQRLTREKRRNQVAKSFVLKIQENKLNNGKREALKMIFVEAKWCYNAILSSNIYSYDTKIKAVIHKDKDMNDVISEYNYLSQAMRQSIKKQIEDEIKVLNTRKKRGFKVGSLKYISEYNSINFKQFGVTHKILGKNKVKLQ